MGDLFVTSAEGVTRTIQLILAPVVMISACAILVGGLVSRSSTINDRLRAMTRERLELVRASSRSVLDDERLLEIDRQLPDLTRRLKIAHQAVLFNYSAIFGFILDMLLIAMTALSNQSWAGLLALIVFMLATILLAMAILLTVREIQVSLGAILYEVERVSRLPSATPISLEERQNNQHEYHLEGK